MGQKIGWPLSALWYPDCKTMLYQYHTLINIPDLVLNVGCNDCCIVI